MPCACSSTAFSSFRWRRFPEILTALRQTVVTPGPYHGAMSYNLSMQPDPDKWKPHSMSAPLGILATRRIPDAAWNRWWKIGELRTADHRGRASSEYMHRHAHEIGAIGEHYFGWMVGLEAAADVNPVAGDDGFDFPNLDVKTAEIISWPWLKIRADKADAAPAGFTFALVAVDIASRSARYCGYVTKEMLAGLRPTKLTLRDDRSSEYTGLKRSLKYGPLSYILKGESLLIKALPPGFQVSPEFSTQRFS